jgi:hypothetical protein
MIKKKQFQKLKELVFNTIKTEYTNDTLNPFKNQDICNKIYYKYSIDFEYIDFLHVMDELVKENKITRQKINLFNSNIGYYEYMLDIKE